MNQQPEEKMHSKYGCIPFGCFLLVAVLIFVAAWCSISRTTTLGLFGRRPTPAEHLKQIGGERVEAALRTPQRVEAVLLQPPKLDEENPAAPKPHELEVVSDSIPVDSTTAAELSNILLNPNQFPDDGLRKACWPMPGVRISYFLDSDRVDVYFCFECAILIIYLNESPVGGQGFDYCYRQLIDTTRKIYPVNERLKKLAVEHRG